ncbi:hypothetical protein H9W95_19030 [Flavobacterium lindanitolerans]|nr:hypothetical protein [Flavobacterium lindanitolerans]
MNKTTLLGVLCLFVMGITQGQVVSQNKSPLEKAQHYLKEKGEVVFTFRLNPKNNLKNWRVSCQSATRGSTKTN